MTPTLGMFDSSLCQLLCNSHSPPKITSESIGTPDRHTESLSAYYKRRTWNERSCKKGFWNGFWVDHSATGSLPSKPLTSPFGKSRVWVTANNPRRDCLVFMCGWQATDSISSGHIWGVLQGCSLTTLRTYVLLWAACLVHWTSLVSYF